MLMFLLLVRVDKKGVNCDLTLTLSLRRGDRLLTTIRSNQIVPQDSQNSP